MTLLLRACAGLSRTYLRYLGASVGALCVDVACFLLLLRVGLSPAAASAIGYAAGIAAHWWLSSRAVFADRLAGTGSARFGQQALFLVSAGVGLAITVGIVGLGSVVGLAPWLAKAVAIVVAFQAVWLLRRHVVFAQGSQP